MALPAFALRAARAVSSLAIRLASELLDRAALVGPRPMPRTSRDDHGPAAMIMGRAGPARRGPIKIHSGTSTSSLKCSTTAT